MSTKGRGESLRRTAKAFVALGEIIALMASGEHLAPALLKKLNQWETTHLYEVDDLELRDPLETQLKFLRSFLAADVLRLSASQITPDTET